jgi:hypothetical protein
MKKIGIPLILSAIAILCTLVSFRPSPPALALGQYYQGGYIVELPSVANNHTGLVVTADSMGKCGHWISAQTLCQNCHTGGFTWRLPTVLELEDHIFVHRTMVPGLHYECTRSGPTPGCDCITQVDCKCNYWSSETIPPVGSSGPRAVQVTFTSPNCCHQGCSQGQGYCRVVAVHNF